MADEQLIKPRELPAAITVFANDAIMTDDGVTVGKATPVQIVDAGAPVATEAEAVAGTDNSKRMTPLTTKQVLDNVSAPAVLRAQAWAESTTAPDPSMPGSKSSRTWALEAAQSAEDAATSETNAATSAGQAAISAGQAVTAMSGSVRFDQAQTLTSGQRQQARDNIGLGTVSVENILPISKGGTGATSVDDARAALNAAIIPPTVTFSGGAGDRNLPAGGTWAWIRLVTNTSGAPQPVSYGAGVAAGGTLIASVGANSYQCFYWRVQ